MKQQWRKFEHYIIIGLLSMLAVFFLPMLGSAVGLGLVLPNTFAGWLVYLATKACVVVINLMMFDQFVKQGKDNVKDNPYFQEAERILLLQKIDDEEILPATYHIRKMYKSKMTTTAIFTVLGVFGFTNAILTFDWVSMLSYLFTIVMGLVFGWISMGKAEEIWVEKHYKYAKKIEREAAERKEAEEAAQRETQRLLEVATPQVSQPHDDTPLHTGGTDLLVADDIHSGDGDIGEPVVVECGGSGSGDMGDASSGDADTSNIHTGIQDTI